MKKIIALLLALGLIFSLAACKNDKNDNKDDPSGPAQTENDGLPVGFTPAKMDQLDFSAVELKNCDQSATATDLVALTLSYTNKNGEFKTGYVIIRLFDEVAPRTVQNFQKLVQSGVYTDSSFHRVRKDTMIQGGEPRDTSTKLTPIKGEFETNGFENNLKHVRGVVSMARSYAPDSATSQFFIVQAEAAIAFDRNYATFGYVVYGMDTVDAINETPTNTSGTPTDPVTIHSATFVTKSDSPKNPLPEINVKKVPTMSSLDFSAVELSACTQTDEITDLVRMNISYTAENGEEVSGDIVIRLYADVAPLTVQNFQTLVKNGFYDGLTFHRVYKNFMIQGGAGNTPLSPIKGEFTSNGFVNNLKHVRGVISMARTYIPDSATSQFFIMHATTASLDGKYASFGYVVYGMETVDAIANVRVQSNPMMNGEMSDPVHAVTINYAAFVTAPQ